MKLGNPVNRTGGDLVNPINEIYFPIFLFSATIYFLLFTIHSLFGTKRNNGKEEQR
jgi:hypothetical protein